ncbi:thiosulfate reductase cytochrome b subunit [Larkinella arboricola]|uniref:Thiosulfate reductase cytochrome b subunit n=1 Tax=Larkinella arboricola TaxID=643671 RepID=A0A327X668_LARAB|nr:cytochrome b/b6 domain-containing protein [Larkinella arboricola]RAK02507.1 thiosulfate reductase cytochrome b subunit [Larkinella arboricola]
MKQIIHKHPLAIRWFHWLNVPILFAMIWSGLLIYWAWDPYKIQIGDTVLVQFFPDSFYQALKLRRRLAEGMSWHFVFMWLFAINGILYVLYTLISGEWRLLVPNRQSLREAGQVLLHDLGIRKTAPPQVKYNGAQRIVYTLIILMGLGSLLTGLAIYKPTQFAWLTSLFGGYETARMWHFVLTVGYVLFFVIHVAQVIRAGWNNFQSMITGFEVKNRLPEKTPSRSAD